MAIFESGVLFYIFLPSLNEIGDGRFFRSIFVTTSRAENFAEKIDHLQFHSNLVGICKMARWIRIWPLEVDLITSYNENENFAENAECLEGQKPKNGYFGRPFFK